MTDFDAIFKAYDVRGPVPDPITPESRGARGRGRVGAPGPPRGCGGRGTPDLGGVRGAQPPPP